MAVDFFLLKLYSVVINNVKIEAKYILYGTP
jgi:hypothetical protein